MRSRKAASSRAMASTFGEAFRSFRRCQGLLGVDDVARRIGERAKLLLHPVGAPAFLEPLLKMLVDLAQMGHIGHA